MSQKPHDRDTTIEDIHRTRERIHDAFGGDIAAIQRDACERQAASGHPIWTPDATNQTLHTSGEARRIDNDESSVAAG
jgi:DUF438 domain-containing protein